MSGHHPKGGPPESVSLLTSMPPLPATECGCPEQDGRIYHQQGTCGDPVVARLGWYATGLPPVHVATCPPGCDGSAHAVAPAPELAAAMAETRAVRDGYQQLCGEFGPSQQSGMSARISLTMLNRHRGNAALGALARTESNSREDVTMRYRRERDEAREQLAELRATVTEFTRVWAELLPSLPDNYTCHLACAEADTAADLFRAAGAGADADAIIAAHVCDADDRDDVHGEADGG